MAFALWLTIAGAFVEIAILFFQKRANPLLRLSEDFVWMAPLMLLSIALAIAAVGSVAALVWRSGPGRSLALVATAAVVFVNLLLLVPGLAHYAAALVAIGLGIQTTRMVARHPVKATRLVRRSAPIILAAMLVFGAVAWTLLRPAAGPSGSTTPGAARPPNVLFITLDTVRAASLSLYGYSRNTTPNLDRFAARGSVFDHAITSSPWTLPSHASMFTGRWAHELSADYLTPLDSKHPTLAEYLGRNGYTSAGFVANLGYSSHETGLGRGFHHYEDYPRSAGQIASSSTVARTLADNFRLRALVEDDEHLSRVPAEDLNRRALDWIGSHAGAPFFVFLNYFDAHEPYLPPPPFDRKFGPGRARGRYSPLHRWLWDPQLAETRLDDAQRQEEIDAYDGALAYLDDQVGRLFADLERRGLLAGTIVIITADHGEEFGEHGVYEHGYSLYRAAVHVPLIVVAPGSASFPRRIGTAVSLRSIAATVADLAGLARGSPFPGASLVPLLQAGSPAAAAFAEPLLSEVSRAPGHPDWFPTSKGDMKAVAFDGVRYIRGGDASEELYEFGSDVWETRNLAALPEHRARLEASRALLDRLVSGGKPGGSR
jgi:arylsulfatase A-like enzyme